MSKIKLKCKQCNKYFEDYKSNKRSFCSKQCADKYRNMGIIIKECKQCGKNFKIPAHRKDAKFCSNKCVGLYNRKKIKLICPICDIEFEVQPHKKNQKTCSRNCYYIYERVELTVKKCLFCNEDFESYESSNKKFCSHKCSTNYHSGKNNCRWNGGQKAYESRRRHLGLTVLNKKIENQEKHHLDWNLILYIPKETHSITINGNNKHTQLISKSMIKMNTKAFNYVWTHQEDLLITVDELYSIEINNLNYWKNK